MHTNQNNYLQYSCFLSSCHTRNEFLFFFFNSIPSDLFYLNIHIVIVKVITITGWFAMYLITITITCNNKNQWLQITFRLLKTCNRLHVITITDYNYNRSAMYTKHNANSGHKLHRTSCLNQFSLISILSNINKASKHCDCRQTITNAYGQCIEMDLGVFQIAIFRSPKIRFILLFSWNINQCCPWNIFGCSFGPQKTPIAPFTVRVCKMGHNKAPYEKVPILWLSLVRPTSWHGMVIFP